MFLADAAAERGCRMKVNFDIFLTLGWAHLHRGHEDWFTAESNAATVACRREWPG